MDNVQSEHKYDAKSLTVWQAMVKPYLVITKPGIIFGNLVATIGGFLFASRGEVNVFLFIATLSGVAMVIASSCVFNNYIDRDIDKLMQRTCHRPSVQGVITPRSSLIYATVLGVAGFLTLFFYTNWLTSAFAIVGFLVYVIIYSLYLKRYSLYSTLVGSISGATPPIIGYCAVTGQFDLASLILLLAFSLWQMPHSFAIAIFRFHDYQAASIAILPVRKGINIAQYYIIAYIIGFALVCSCLVLAGYVGNLYLVLITSLNAYWLWLAVGWKSELTTEQWGRKLFIFSVIVITVLSITISIDYR